MFNEYNSATSSIWPKSPKIHCAGSKRGWKAKEFLSSSIFGVFTVIKSTGIFRTHKFPKKILQFSTFRAKDEVFEVICCPGNGIAKYPITLAQLLFSTFRANDEVFEVICCPGNEIAKYHLNNSYKVSNTSVFVINCQNF
ncbi:unnamed protein product [Caenorhabditis angaria]|uniref:Uncharacterized protein n=1 Tax=Caenorhabditis angaria TaxID=860376 RepID=A0A9P1J024_9PELO|nr:unnamed protein product [Caenorhabditis angaria]